VARTGPIDQDNQRDESAESKPEDRGLVCPRCACRHFFVVYTMPARDGSIRRLKECRNCGQRLRTREKPIG
jgi:hypothetical protein